MLLVEAICTVSALAPICVALLPAFAELVRKVECRFLPNSIGQKYDDMTKNCNDYIVVQQIDWTKTPYRRIATDALHETMKKWQENVVTSKEMLAVMPKSVVAMYVDHLLKLYYTASLAQMTAQMSKPFLKMIISETHASEYETIIKYGMVIPCLAGGAYYLVQTTCNEYKVVLDGIRIKQQVADCFYALRNPRTVRTLPQSQADLLKEESVALLWATYHLHLLDELIHKAITRDN
jgi:hypothetical protein